MASTDILLKIRREGDGALTSTARDLRTVSTAAQAASKALMALGGRQAAPNVAGYQAQAQALRSVAQAAQAAQGINVAPAADPRALNDLNRLLSQYRSNLSQTQTQAQASIAPRTQSSSSVGGAGGAPAAAQTERQMLALARAQAAVKRESGDLAGAEQTLRTALSGVTRETVSSLGAQRQLNRVQNELAVGANAAAGKLQVLPRTINGLSGAAASAASAVGGLFAAQQIASFGAEAIRAANDLEDVQSSLRIVAKDTATYDRALAAAAASQRLFGGSLAENIGDVQSFVLTSRTAGVALEDLITVSRQLGTLDPGQGLRGANIALRELLSGNPNSLAMRFELPRATLKALTNESATTADRLAALSSYLADAGITAEAVSGKLNNTSQAYRDLGAAADAAKNQVGSLLAQVAEQPVRTITVVVQAASEGAKALSTGQGATGIAQEAQQRAAATAATYDEYVAAVQRAQTAGQAQADQTLSALGPLGSLAASVGGLIVQNQMLSEAEYNAARASAAATTGVAAQADAHVAAAEATREAESAARADALAKIEQAAQAGLVQAQQAKLNAELERAAAAGGPVQAAAQQIAKAFDLEASAIIPILNLLREKNALQNAPQRENKVPPQLRQGYGGTAPADVGRSEANAKAAQDFLKATGTTAQQLGIVRSQLKGVTVGSAEYYRLKQDELRIQEQINTAAKAGKTGGGGGGAATKGLDATFKADLKLQESAQDRLIQLEAERRKLEAAGQTNGLRYKQVLIEIGKAQDDITKAAQEGAQAERERAQAAIGAGLAQIEDARKRREEDTQIAAAQRIIERPATFDENQRQLAREEIDRINLERQQRQLAIQEQQARAGGAPVQAQAPVIPANVAAALPALTGAAAPPPPAPQGGGAPLVVQLVVDGQELTRLVVPGVVASLRGGLVGVAAGG